MATVTTARSLDWVGGSLDELLGFLAEPALSARVEARQHDGIGERVVGEVHMVAGGFSDAFAGPARGDDAVSRLRGLPDLRFRVEPRLPHPVTGNLSPPGLEEGTLGDRPLAELMRYCEEFVLTCTVEVTRAEANARVSYRRGELVRALVNGSESSDALPEVMAWPDGNYRFVLPQLVLPRPGGEAAAPEAVAPDDLPATVPTGPAPQQSVGHRSTMPFLPQANSNELRGTRPGMPIDVFDKPQVVRTTDIGIIAVSGPVAPSPLSTQPGSSYTPRQTRAAETAPQTGARATSPGFEPTRAAREPEPVPQSVTAAPKRAATPILSPAARSAGTAARSGVRPGKKSIYDLPLGVHVGLGLALGAVVVVAYWLLQR